MAPQGFDILSPGVCTHLHGPLCLHASLSLHLQHRGALGAALVAVLVEVVSSRGWQCCAATLVRTVQIYNRN